ncbi:hypothetical protein Q5H92_11560 [Hymenobacter sp. M29]|uniref:Uncharacterized protein n=1 Tax=Hymenobacter mellowenesis TaxID=3063995 RepID=A0ABT9AE74_9BACT|nr:hypothetical protein [Hymenobacter sp. M29]MDO7846997.1 hypothetical protein [Hymenobacter sp. M29]
MAKNQQNPQPLVVPTNQLHITLPNDYSKLLQAYSIWRYRLSPSQEHYRKFQANSSMFYPSFTNAYKNQIDRPFYFYTHDKPQASLYTLLPIGHTAKPWQYPFGNPNQVPAEDITAELVSPDELALQPPVLIKLMMALCFYEHSERERERRVCQSKFYLRVKGSATGKRLVAVEVKPQVDSEGDLHTLTVKVEANTFAKIDPTKVGTYASLGTYYELFASLGHTYLRQLRPSQVATFKGDVYKQAPTNGKRTTADWHHNGNKREPDKYRESRSYQVRHVQERLHDFLTTYGFGVDFGEESMLRLRSRATPLPLNLLPTIQVVDNRLNRADAPAAQYVEWLNDRRFESGKTAFALSFELVEAGQVNPEQPLLVLTDAGKDAFVVQNWQPGLLATAGYADPYQQLYAQLPDVVKQTLNVNLNEVTKFAVAEDYLRHDFPAPLPKPAATETDEAPIETDEARKQRTTATKHLKTLNIKADVCLTELWLKWVLAGKAPVSPAVSLPLLNTLSDDWAFLTDGILLYFNDGELAFADVEEPAGKRILKERFMPWQDLKQHFMARQPKYAHNKPSDEEKADKDIRQAHFVLVGREVFELERTETIAMPNWPVIRAIKAQNPEASAKRQEAIGVYAGGIWYQPEARRYIVGSTQSSNAAEARGHHLYQIHQYNGSESAALPTLLSLLTVTFVRRNQYTVWPYPFDLIRLYREVGEPVA